MLSKKNYHGKLSYNEYTERFRERNKLLTDHLREQINIQDNIKNRIDQKKKELTDKGKEAINKAIEDHTGFNPSNIKKVLDEAIGPSSNKTEEKRREDVIQGIIIAKSHKPNTESLNQEEIDHAKMAEASKIHYLNDDNGATIQEFLNKNKLGTLLPESDESGIVVRRPNGDIEISYRGTALTNQPNSQDFITDAKIMTGMEEGLGGVMPKTKQYTDADAQFKSVMDKYGSIDHISGYSRGGAIALYLGNKNNIETTTFNPLVGPRLATGSQNTTAKHTIIRTTEDPVSMGLAATSNVNHESWIVKSLKPLAKFRSLIPVKNIYDAHRLNNFTEQGARKTGLDQDEIHANRIKEAGVKATQIKALDDLSESLKGGDSFSDYMKKNHPNEIVDTTNGPRIRGNRLTPDSFLVKNWKKYGGEFTEGEAKWINDTWDASQGRIELDYENRGHHEEEGDKKTNNKKSSIMMEDNVDNNLLTSPPRETKPPTEVMPNEPEYEGVENDKLNDNFTEWGNQKKTMSQDGFSNQEQDEYMLLSNKDKVDYKNKLSGELEDALATHAEISVPMEEAGLTENLRGVNLTNLGIGYVVGNGVSSALNFIPGYSELNPIKQEGILGGATAVGTVAAASGLGLETTVATVGAGALAPEIAAGGAGVIAGVESAKAIGSAVKKAGGTQLEQDAAADIGGGAVGGATSGLVGTGVALGADALLGSEYGSAFGPEGILIGAGIGAGLGALSLAVDVAKKPLSEAWDTFKSLF